MIQYGVGKHPNSCITADLGVQLSQPCTVGVCRGVRGGARWVCAPLLRVYIR